MANLKCRGSWASTTIDANGVEHDDGNFVLHVDESTGEVTGFHDVDGIPYPVWGLCRHGTFSGHKIDIWEPRLNAQGEIASAFHYRGKIKLLKDDDREIEDGKRRTLSAIKTDDAKVFLEGDDDWVGTHTTLAMAG